MADVHPIPAQVAPAAPDAAAQPPAQNEVASETLYIQNLNEKIKVDVLKASLRGLFKSYGEVLDVVAHSNLRMRGQAFVSFASPEIAAKAMKEVRGFPLYSKPMQISFAKTRSDAVVKHLDAESFEAHKAQRADHKRTTRYSNPLKQKFRTKRMAAELDGAAAAPAPKRPAVQMPDEYLPPNKILFLQNLPETVTKDQLMALFSQLAFTFTLILLLPPHRDIAFVEYLDEGSAGVAKDALHNYKLDGENKIKACPLYIALLVLTRSIDYLCTQVNAYRMIVKGIFGPSIEVVATRANHSLAPCIFLRISSFHCYHHQLSNPQIAQTSKQPPIMPIVFEDEDEYSEGLDIIAEHLKSMGSKRTTGTECVTVSERTRSLRFQKATAPKRSPSPMDVDSADAEDMQVEERGSFFSAGDLAPAQTAYAGPTGTSPGVATAAAKPPAAGAHPTSASEAPPWGNEPAAQTPARELSAFGAELDPFLIAHDATAQRLMDANHLTWGTTYEIARGVTKGQWTWSAVTREKIQKLCGSNACAAHQVAAVMQDREVPRVAEAEVWAEYNREQAAIIENQGRGLGGLGLWKGKDDWYGGRIQQVGRLIREGPTRFSIQLEKPEIRRSHRFSRFLGSRRILQVRVVDDLLYKYGDEVRTFLSSSRFILCGRVFLPFHAKEGSMYLTETDQNYERLPNDEDGDHLRIHQPISKWSTRWALGLSTSVPSIEIDPKNIFELPDIYVSPKDWEGKAPAEKVLTDGCGLINGAALTQIMRLMKYSSRPTAIQGRIGGSKGMWLLHHDPLEQIPDGPAKIWIRSSQTKIQLGPTSELGRAQRIFDLLAPSRVTTPSRLSSQTLVNLASNGISHQILKELMARGLQEEIQSFIDWNKPQSMVLVWKAVERAGSVVVSRLRRLLSRQARALGLGQLRSLENQSQEEVEEDGELNHLQPLTDIGHKKSSGHPITLHETVLELLQSGFHPLKLELLFKKLENVITLVLDEYVEKFHIPIMESCEAYIVPDPYGVLEEGQIHFKSSEPIINPSTGEQTDIILGDVLVSRNPTRLPSDIQKVQAVAHPKLSNYVNVIVFPIKGKQSLASFLGGGDYDGDVVMINWCKPLVEQFRGSPLCTAPSNLSDSFERRVEHVTNFDRRITDLGPKPAQQEFQRILLLGLEETRVGLYSLFHDAAVYEYGYGNPRAIHLAYMFTTCLDASKTGLRVKSSVFDQDRQQWGVKKPWYRLKVEQGKELKGKGKGVKSNPPNLLKREGSSFILDDLVMEGDKLRKEALQKYRSLKVQSTDQDQDLSRPWTAAKAKAAQARSQGILGFSENLEDIQAQVVKAWDKYRRAVAISQGTSPSATSSKDSHYDEAASVFAQSPPFRGFVFFSDEDVQTLKASFASTKNLNFAFSVAFHDLCAIKARAAGNIALTHQFAQCITVPNIVARTLSQAHAADT
ncbi:RNA dependent RNA polymerase-domain-containing protein [Boletus reticuloceps]|uniref:RNA-dependent RNA polymerase n=1 Tax=Boletus reticuloceps TaxID=495285 RepID=A0A8I2Z0X5_9AGAM|nr:RNA dependent RNA polymerase-domain-containing protein [Boletus reticuloceps]